MANEANDKLIQDIHDRVAAMDASVKEAMSEVKIKAIIEGLLATDKDFARKMRFGAGAGDAKLVGTKYARFGLDISDIEWLYDLQVSLKGQKRVSEGFYQGPTEELENTWRAISEAYYVPMDQVRAMDKRALDDLFPRIPLNEFHGRDRELARRGAFELTGAYKRAFRAMDTAESGYGSQLIGAQYVRDLWEAARAESRVMALFDTFEMLDPTAYLPVEVDIPELLFVSESTANNSSNYGTSKTGSQRVQVDAKKFLIHQMWSGEMEEDSIIPFIPFLRRQAQLSIAYYGDSLCLNGDTTNAATGNINLDDADPADTKHYLAFDGIRHVGIVDNTGNQKNLAGAITLAALNAVPGRMIDSTNKVDWGHPTNAEDVVHICDPETADQVSVLDEVLSWKEFQGRPLMTGQVATIGGIVGRPVIAAMAQPKTEADGKVSTTGGNNTKGQVTSCNRRAFKVGWRRRVKLETERIPATDQSRIVYSLRLGFGRFTPTGAASGIEGADVIFNITLP